MQECIVVSSCTELIDTPIRDCEMIEIKKENSLLNLMHQLLLSAFIENVCFFFRIK
jgi:hypothetical protein